MVDFLKFPALHLRQLRSHLVVERLGGDVAVVNSRYLMKGTFRDHIFAGRYRFTRVWVRQRGAWRLASSQQTFFVEPREVEGDEKPGT